jgi:hypothetical protein
MMGILRQRPPKVMAARHESRVRERFLPALRAQGLSDPLGMLGPAPDVWVPAERGGRKAC